MSIYSKILHKAVYPSLFARENRLSTLSHYSFFLKSQFWSTDQLREYQWKLLKKLLQDSYNNTIYYKNIMDERGLTPDSFKSFDDLKKLPVLTRDITYDQQEQFFSSKYAKSSLQEFRSGGTTGQQAILFRDQESFNLKLALAWRHEAMMGKQPGDKIAYIWPAAMDINKSEQLKAKIKNRYLLRTIIYHAGTLDAASLDYISKDLYAFNPKFLKVFPSALHGLTEYCVKNNIKLPKIKAIMSTGEKLLDYQKKLFEDVYQCQVFDMYGSREVGNSACECDKMQGMHIAMETSHFEFIEKNKEVAPGSEGEIIITDLTNFAFPLIRYAITDYGLLLPGKCACGRGLARMGKALGRLTGNVLKKDGTKINGHVLSYIIGDEAPFIGQHQIVQKTYDDFIVRLTNKPEPTQEAFDFITRKLKELIDDSINIKFEVVNEMQKEKSGKFLFIKCEIEDK